MLAVAEKETVEETETATTEELTVQYEELLKAHTQSESRRWTQAEITDTLVATQNPGTVLKPMNAEILVDLINHKDQNLKMAVVQGIARSAANSHNQVRLTHYTGFGNQK